MKFYIRANKQIQQNYYYNINTEVQQYFHTPEKQRNIT